MELKITMSNNHTIKIEPDEPTARFISNFFYDDEGKLIDKLVRLPNGSYLNPTHVSSIE